MEGLEAKLGSREVGSEDKLVPVCVVSLLSGPAYGTLIGRRLVENKQAFCNACGYRCVLTGDRLSDRPPPWDKVMLVLAAMRHCNLTIWVDADIVFRHPFRVASLVTPLHVAHDYYGINSGVFFAARSAAPLWAAAWNRSEYMHSDTWEQAALKHVLRESAAARAQATIMPELVAYPTFRTRNADAAPLYHPAGVCRAGTSPTRCQRLLNRTLDRVQKTALLVDGSQACRRVYSYNRTTRQVRSSDVRRTGNAKPARASSRPATAMRDPTSIPAPM
jgi:hypothetical protein